MSDHGTIDREQDKKQETAALAGNPCLFLTAQTIQEHGLLYSVVCLFKTHLFHLLR